jgi:hypothetical protein
MGKGKIMTLYQIDYDGFIVIDAKSIKEAEEKANKMLSQSNLPNDGTIGEWYLTDSERI